jgi:hypothetical protein
MTNSRRLAVAWPLVLLAAYYALWYWLIYHPPQFVLAASGAAAESKTVYGFWSGFGGTLIFSAALLFPPWYYRHTCHHHFSCLRWGKYEAAGGVFKLCGTHYPNPRRDGETHEQWIARLDDEWRHPLRLAHRDQPTA